MQPTGRARVETEIDDISVLMQTGLKGISAVLGITERGDVFKSRVVGNWQEYQKYFGGLLSTSKFPLLCKRALERGGKLRIGRVAHFTDVEDKTTLSGTAATLVTEGAIETDPSLTLNANSIGAWGNGLKMSVSTPANNLPDTVDVLVQLAGYPNLDKKIANVTATLDAMAINNFNAASPFIQITSDSAGFVLTADTTYQLAGGAQDTSVIVAADYIGSAAAGAGLHIFDGANDFVKIAVPEMAMPEIDAALFAYVSVRQDCRFVLRTPTGIDGATAVDYRLGQGVYSHQPLDTWLGDMFFGDLDILDPLDNGRKFVTAIGDVLGAMSTRDNKAYEWFSVAGSKRGRIYNNYGVEYNVGTPARATEFDLMDINGVNPVIDDTDYGTVIWGNSSLSRAATLLRHSNVCDLLIYIVRAVTPYAKSELFDPNDTETWKAIWRKVNPVMTTIKNKRGVWDFLYQGDQLIDDISQATVNEPENIDAGQYVFILWIKPKVGMKYVGIRVVVANSGVSFSDVSEEVTF